ncbi:MAG: transposase [Bacteroidales bacterium]
MKCRYKVLGGDSKVRCRDLIKQICITEDINILSGVVRANHVHLNIEHLPSKAISDIFKKFKGKMYRRISTYQKKVLWKNFLFPKIRKPYFTN